MANPAPLTQHLGPYQFKAGNKGRPPGPNKLTQFLREVMGSTFHKIGGADAFAEWAAANRTDFYTKLWIKLLPDSSQLSDDEREKVLDAMLGVQKVITQVYDGDSPPIVEIKAESQVTEVPPSLQTAPDGSVRTISPKDESKPTS